MIPSDQIPRELDLQISLFGYQCGQSSLGTVLSSPAHSNSFALWKWSNGIAEALGKHLPDSIESGHRIVLSDFDSVYTLISCKDQL